MERDDNKALVIFHDDCIDGFTAAWVVHKAWGEDAVYKSADYHSPIPSLDEVRGRDVILVDFSWPADVLQSIALVARSVFIVDHHPQAADLAAQELGHNVMIIYDKNRSGAGIVWDHYFPTLPRPEFISLVEDRDLWLFKKPYSRQFDSFASSFERSFLSWDALSVYPLEAAVSLGAAILRKEGLDIMRWSQRMTRRMLIGGVEFPVLNVPKSLASEAANFLAQGYEGRIGACYHDRTDSRKFDLRSVPGGISVRKVAIGYGGEGHDRAAGFSVPFDRLAELGLL